MDGCPSTSCRDRLQPESPLEHPALQRCILVTPHLSLDIDPEVVGSSAVPEHGSSLSTEFQISLSSATVPNI